MTYNPQVTCNYSVEVLNDPRLLRVLKAEWNAVADRFQSPLLRSEWFLAAAEAFYTPEQLNVMVVRRGGQVEAIAPLARGENGRVALHLIGTDRLYEPSGLLYRDEESLRVVVDELYRLKQPLLLKRVESQSAEVRLLTAGRPKHGLCSIREVAGAPWLPVTGSWEQYQARLSPRRRSSWRRSRRRAEAAGVVRCDILTPAPPDVPHLFDDLVRVEARGWKLRAGTALACDPRMRRFFLSYSLAAAAAGSLRLAFLSVRGEPIAALLGVEHARRFWVMKIGHDQSWNHCSPGALLMNYCLRYAFERRLEAFEFLGTDEPWIHAWEPRVRSYVVARVYPLSVASAAALAGDLVRFTVERISQVPETRQQLDRWRRCRQVQAICPPLSRHRPIGGTLNVEVTRET